MFLRLYSGEDGRSHLEELQFPSEDVETVSHKPGASITFRRVPGGNFVDWHTAPRRQYVVILSGAMEIGIGDGTVRRLGPGDVLLAEDLTGQGHTTRAAGNQPRVSVTIPLEQE